MDFKDLILIRESCRSYTNQKIEKEKLDLLVEMARLSPSAVNAQPWTIHVVHSNELLPKIAESVSIGPMNAFAHQAKGFIVIVEERQKLLAKTVSDIKHLDYVSIDIGILTSHIVLAASSIGLGSCILGWFNEANIKKILNLPKSKKVRLVITLGYPKNPTPRVKKRKDLKDIYRYY